MDNLVGTEANTETMAYVESQFMVSAIYTLHVSGYKLAIDLPIDVYSVHMEQCQQ